MSKIAKQVLSEEAQQSIRDAVIDAVKKCSEVIGCQFSAGFNEREFKGTNGTVKHHEPDGTLTVTVTLKI
jgi:hypothetical protein